MAGEEALSGLASVLGKGSRCGMRLVWLISLPLLLFLFALAGFAGVVNFNVEVHSVVMIGVIFVIFLFFMIHNAYYASCLLRRNFEQLKRDLSAYIGKNLLAIAGTEKANAPLDDFLAQEAAALRNENFSSVAAGVFPTLGILGTFISIAVSMPDFSAQTSEVLEHEISVLLGGVGTAFYVSIYGIFLSIWWIFFEKSGLSRFQKDAARIKDATRNLFWGKEEIEQTYFRKSMENFEKLNTVFDTLASQSFIESLNRTLEQRMHIFERIIEHEQEAAKKVASLLEESTATQQAFIERQADMQQTLASMTAQLTRFGEALDAHGAKMHDAGQRFASEYDRAITVSEELGKQIGVLNAALANINVQNVQQLYGSVIENIESMKKEIDQIGRSFDARMNGFDARFLEKLQQTLRLIDSETAQIVSQISELRSGEEF